jgi:superfamily II DNA or RNA helicase
MSLSGREPKDHPLELLPHQAALVETVFNPTSKRVIRLLGGAGLGKITALVALSGRLLQEQLTARVLFLVPRLLQSQFVERLRNAGIPVLLVDRYQFREMLDSTVGGEFWPSRMAVVLSMDFAKQPDVQESLVKTHWDLVIADEAHLFRGNRAEVLRRVGAVAERVVLSTLPYLELPYTFPVEDITVVEWRRDRIIDHDGRPLDAAPRPVLHEVPFSTTPAELSLRKMVSALYQMTEAGTGPQDWIAKLLLRRLQSSPAALESLLQRRIGHIEGLKIQGGMDALLAVFEEEVPDDRLTEQVDFPSVEKEIAIATRALQEIEKIDSDSKLSAFVVLLSHLDDAHAPSRRICVFTEYVSTLYYLAAEIEGLGLACRLLHGGMSSEDRHRSLTLFSSDGGILVATGAVMTEGLNLHEVTELVLYDVPASKVALQEVLGRFDRFGRVSQLNVYVLTPSGESEDVFANQLATLRELLGAPSSPNQMAERKL